MPKETGEVLQIEGDMAKVRFERSSACAKCEACSRGLSDKEMLLTVENQLHAHVGDSVQVSVATRGLLTSSVLAYLVPLAFLIVGVWIGVMMGRGMGVAQPDVIGAVAGIVFAALAFVVLKLLEPVLRRKRRFYPQVVAIVDKPQEYQEKGENHGI